jgi:hypothetical protein
MAPCARPCWPSCWPSSPPCSHQCSCCMPSPDQAPPTPPCPPTHPGCAHPNDPQSRCHWKSWGSTGPESRCVTHALRPPRALRLASCCVCMPRVLCTLCTHVLHAGACNAPAVSVMMVSPRRTTVSAAAWRCQRARPLRPSLFLAPLPTPAYTRVCTRMLQRRTPGRSPAVPGGQAQVREREMYVWEICVRDVSVRDVCVRER